MTRVEKFRKYRREIANMKVENMTSKKEVFEQVEKNIGESNRTRYGYDDILEIHDIYDTFGHVEKKRKTIHIRKDQLIYVSIAIFIISIIIIALVFVGINLWGK